MANGICVFAENYNGNLEPVVAELVRAAHCIKETTGEKIQAAVLAEDCKALVSQLEQLGFDEIYAVETDRNCLFQDDAVSQAMAEMLKRIDPSSVLIPATPTGRSVFSRVAARLGCGMTADCTECRGYQGGRDLFHQAEQTFFWGKRICHHRDKGRGLSPDDDGKAGCVHPL